MLGYCLALSIAVASAAKEESVNYRLFPRRTPEEAAVIEWGHSAIISALDVSVAHFGPQTSQAALFEVETMPVLASPINGVMLEADGVTPAIRPLENAEDVEGNAVVMTNAGQVLSGLQMAQVAQKSGAAALLVVNIDEKHPDDIYRLSGEDSEIDIPVVMMSYNSATVLTTVTVTPDMAVEEVVNHGMPERIHLYAGGDRPFFEDVVSAEPAVYLFHNLLSEEECDALIQRASSRLQPIGDKEDPLQLLQSPENYANTQRAYLWQGLWQNAGAKAVEERIEQATGFPADHLTDFIVDRIDAGGQWQPHTDHLKAVPLGLPMATITVFLTESPDGGVVFPRARGGAVQVRPKQGMAVIHYNVKNEKNDAERRAIQALLESSETVYIARKYVLTGPLSTGRRVVLPLIATLAGGRLPGFVSSAYDFMAEQFGHEDGGTYFDKLCVFFPLLLILGLGQLAAEKTMEQIKKPSTDASQDVKEATKTTSSRSKRSKTTKSD